MSLLETSLPIVTATGVSALAEHEAELRLGNQSSASRCARGSRRPGRPCGASARPSGRAPAGRRRRRARRRHAHRSSPPRAARRGCARTSRPHTRSRAPRSAAAGRARPAGPTLDRALAAKRCERIVVVEHLDDLSHDPADTRAETRQLRAQRADQYVARPPEMSKHAPVENDISSLASQQISAATSSARRRARAESAPSCTRCAPPRSGSRIGVLITAGAMQFTRIPLPATPCRSLSSARSPRPSTTSTRPPSDSLPCRRSTRR